MANLPRRKEAFRVLQSRLRQYIAHAKDPGTRMPEAPHIEPALAQLRRNLNNFTVIDVEAIDSLLTAVVMLTSKYGTLLVPPEMPKPSRYVVTVRLPEYLSDGSDPFAYTMRVVMATSLSHAKAKALDEVYGEFQTEVDDRDDLLVVADLKLKGNDR